MVGAALALVAAHHPDSPAVVFGPHRLTYAELNGRACRLANALAGLGVAKGDRVAALLHNGPPLLEGFFAVAKLGAIFVPLNFRLATPEIARLLDDARPSVLIYGDELAPAVAPLLGTAACPRRLVQVGEPDGDAPRLEGALDYASCLAAHPPREPDVEVAPEHDQLLVYTSGTTGQPKGAVWTHATTLFSSMAKIIDFGLAPTDTTVVFGPLFHVGPLMDLAVPLLLRGGTVVLGPSRGFDPAHLLAVIERERGTVVSIYPTMWRRVLALSDLGRHDLGSVRLFLTGGEPLPRGVLNGIHDRFPEVPFVNTYGSTEGGPITTFLRPEHRVARAGSIGTGAFGVEVRIVDEAGRQMPRGAVGELVVRSPFVCKGYWNRPDATAAARRNGWWHTGDLAREDDDGFLWIAGRKKDLIISGAENIYSVEVEQVIQTLPGVAEVAVVGIPDAEWGEAVVAYVVRTPGADLDPAGVVEHCRTHLAGYKKPRHVVFVDELPRTTVGKVSKETLRRWAQDNPPAGHRPLASRYR